MEKAFCYFRTSANTYAEMGVGASNFIPSS
jgi:hypothetical protein